MTLALAAAGCGGGKNQNSPEQTATEAAQPKPIVVDGKYVCQRPDAAERLFASQSVERKIAEVQAMLTNERLAWMFGNCFPNTLDTTVHYLSLIHI